MKMKKYLEMGAEKAGSYKELSEIINTDITVISSIKAGKRGLNDAACIDLADYLKIDRLEVIAASNLVTEKDEKKRKIFERCFSKAASAAGIGLLIGGISIMSPPPANAAISPSQLPSLYIMLNRIGEIGKEGLQIKFRVIVITCGFHCN